MRVMVLVKATKNSEAGVMPSETLLADMGKFNGVYSRDRQIGTHAGVIWMDKVGMITDA